MSNTLTNYGKEFEIDNNPYGKKEKLAYQTRVNIIRDVSNHYHNDQGKEIRETYLEMVEHLEKLSTMCDKKTIDEDKFREVRIMVGFCAPEIMILLDDYLAEVKDDVAQNDIGAAYAIEHFFKQ